MQRRRHAVEPPSRLAIWARRVALFSIPVALKLTTASSGTQTVAGLPAGALDTVCAGLAAQSTADGQTPYYPASPSGTGTPLAVDCAIALNASGTGARRITIPHVAGGRIWFSIGGKLTFLLNPGPGLVEPSVTNASDPNINTLWDFAEFTYNSTELYANISAVDFFYP